MTLDIGSRLGHYEILSPLGAGGMGEVWRARDGRLGRDVALKILPAAVAEDPERLQRFEREAQVLAALNHPHIAAIHGIEDSTSVKALVLELVEGETLAERIARGPMPVAAATAIARQIAEALAAAHEKGIVHRDLKPQNVKLDLEDRVKVLDFGLAKALDPAAATASTSPTLMNSPTLTAAGTQLGVILGTAAYMAPEQARGGPIDKRADIFAFGSVLYEMLTGRRAFEGDTVSDTLAAVLRAEVDWSALPAATPAPVRTLLARCLEKDRKKRLHDIGDAQFELEAASLPVPPATPAESAGARAAWLPWTIAALLAVALAAALLLPRTGKPASSTAANIRLPLGVPDGFSLALDNQVAVAISPDGRKIAMTVRDKAGSRLLLRDLGELEPRLVEGSEGAQGPMFSPDGEWLAFHAGSALKKVPVAGGPPIQLAPSTGQNRGATYCPDGSLVVAPNSAVGLQRLPADGGPPVALTTPDLKRQERTHRWPAALANGKAVVFTSDTVASTEFYDDARIEAVVLATGERKVLIEGSSRAVVVGDQLVFARGGVLFASSFDADRLEVSGAPRPVLQGVATDVATGAAHFDVSPGGSLVYVPGSSDAIQEDAGWIDRAGTATSAGIPQGIWSQVVLSPDGRRAALSGSPGSTSDIWVVDLQTSALNRLTFDGVATDPIWTRDGTRIAYGLQRADDQPQIYWQPSDGSGSAELLYDGERLAMPRSFSPDGHYLVIDHGAATGTSDLLLLSLDGQRQAAPLVASPADEYSAEISPDGRHLAYTSDASGIHEVYVRPFPAGEGRWQISIGGGFEPRWSADGRELFYRDDGALMRVSIDTRVGFAAGRPEQVAEGMLTGGNPSTYSPAPDGQRFLRLMHRNRDARAGAALVLGWSDDLRRRMRAEAD